MAISIVNGKQVTLPNGSITASDVVRASGRNANPSTRAVFRTGKDGTERLKPGQSFQAKAGDKFKVGPDRVKGSGESCFRNDAAPDGR